MCLNDNSLKKSTRKSAIVYKCYERGDKPNTYKSHYVEAIYVKGKKYIAKVPEGGYNMGYSEKYKRGFHGYLRKADALEHAKEPCCGKFLVVVKCKFEDIRFIGDQDYDGGSFRSYLANKMTILEEVVS